MKSPSELRSIKTAQNILKRYYISDPSHLDLEGIIGCENILYKKSSFDSFQGNLIRTKKTAILNVNSKITDINKVRFIQAHELGHWFMHSDILTFACTTKDLSGFANNPKQIEVEANTFASEILIPEFQLQNFCLKKELSYDLLNDCTKFFKVSLTALSFKYLSSDLEPILLIYCSNNKLEWSKASHRFPFAMFGNSIPKGSLTANYFSKPFDKPELKVSEAKTWFQNDYKVKSDDYINEMVIPMPKYNACLTFIWIFKLNF